jgi:hypothetical protein
MVVRSAAEVELDHLLLQPIYHQENSPLAYTGYDFYEPRVGLELGEGEKTLRLLAVEALTAQA